MPSDSDNGQAWYHAGLRFECTQCGNCCTGAPGFVWIDAEELNTLAAFLSAPLEEVVALHTRETRIGRSLREKDNGDCVFYDKMAGCTIYVVRPAQCRTWPFWESNLKSPSSWQRTCQTCPGSGKGELIPVEEISRRLNVIKL